MDASDDRQSKLVAHWLRLNNSIIQLSEIDAALLQFRADNNPVGAELEEERDALFMAIRTQNYQWITTSVRYMYRLIFGVKREEFLLVFAIKKHNEKIANKEHGGKHQKFTDEELYKAFEKWEKRNPGKRRGRNKFAAAELGVTESTISKRATKSKFIE